eukprot:TRINITY_DN185_c4_g1_i1.p1 TRINITY_DN185_c4_g1~~TRINITY_DN185_c4_g1_i1.p1  ORF type:complete len:648 (-),score=168.89 TRINITY_DN185_c4_g1_i1:55-1998(-)
MIRTNNLIHRRIRPSTQHYRSNRKFYSDKFVLTLGTCDVPREYTSSYDMFVDNNYPYSSSSTSTVQKPNGLEFRNGFIQMFLNMKGEDFVNNEQSSSSPSSSSSSSSSSSGSTYAVSSRMREQEHKTNNNNNNNNNNNHRAEPVSYVASAVGNVRQQERQNNNNNNNNNKLKSESETSILSKIGSIAISVAKNVSNNTNNNNSKKNHYYPRSSKAYVNYFERIEEERKHFIGQRIIELVRQSNIVKATNLFLDGSNHIPRETKHQQYIMAKALRALLRSNALDSNAEEVRLIIERCKELNLVPEISSINLCIRMCSSLPDLQLSRELFHLFTTHKNVLAPNAFTYNYMIQTMANTKVDVDEISKFINYSHSQGFPLTSRTYKELLLYFIPDQMDMYNITLNYMKSSGAVLKSDHCHQVLQQLQEHGFREEQFNVLEMMDENDKNLNRGSLVGLVDDLISSDDQEEVKRLLEVILRCEFQVDNYMLNKIFFYFSNQLKDEEAFWKYFESSLRYGYTPSVKIFHSIARRYIKISNLGGVIDSVRAMITCGYSIDVYMFNIILQIFTRNNNFQMLERIFREMIDLGIHPNGRSFGRVAFLYLKNKDIQGFWSVLSVMSGLGIKVDKMTKKTIENFEFFHMSSRHRNKDIM